MNPHPAFTYRQTREEFEPLQKAKQRVFICSELHRPPLWPIWQVLIAGKRYSHLNQGLLTELQRGTTPEELGLDPDDEEDD